MFDYFFGGSSHVVDDAIGSTLPTYVAGSTGDGGANLLVGGLDSAFMLEPLSVQAQTGVNLAVAVTSLELIHSFK